MQRNPDLQAENLHEAIDFANQTVFGLTSGLESLDGREQKIWKGQVRAGNLYINRVTTGAITLRQPFSGIGKSALGPGIKAGGPNYVAQFMDSEETGYPVTGSIQGTYALLRLVHEWQRKVNWNEMGAYAKNLKKTNRAVKSYLFQALNPNTWLGIFFYSNFDVRCSFF